MRKFIDAWLQKIRDVTEGHGFVCDYCGAEVFEYPEKRLCEDCENSLRRIGERVCEKCGRETRAAGICLDCKAKVRAFAKGFAPFVYRGETASLVNRMKNGKPRLARFFGENMAAHFLENYPETLPNTEEEPLLLLPVPMTREKRRERGYNQAEKLTLAVLHELQKRGIAAYTDFEVLEKKRDTTAQKQMNSREREESVQGAYHVHKRKECRGKTVVLIDDILTTGTTSGECAERLLGAGARAVYLLVAAALPERE
ncbi:MAG: ComF family protein [Clostridia bacterium]|nr:ComF family protein [Clostridia bacterium]